MYPYSSVGRGKRAGTTRIIAPATRETTYTGTRAKGKRGQNGGREANYRYCTSFGTTTDFGLRGTTIVRYDQGGEGKGDSIEQEPLRVDEREWEQEQERYPERAGEDEAGGGTRGA